MKGLFILCFFTLFVCSCNKNPGTDPTDPDGITVSKDKIQFNSNSNQRDSFDITYRSNWKITISSSVNWLQVSHTNGNGNQKIIITSTQQNTSDENRTATLIISAIDNSTPEKTVTVAQSAFTSTTWQIKSGGPYAYFQDAAQDADGSFISVGGLLTDPNNLYSNDVFIEKRHPDGQLAWQKTFGTPGNDYANAVIATNGGYMVAGTTFTPDDGDISTPQTGNDGWLIKLDVDGNLVWQKSYGFLQDDVFYKIIADVNGGFLLTGYKNFTGWLLKIDDAGGIIWDTTITSPHVAYITSGYQTPDGSYVVAGSFNSPPSGNLGLYKGKWDYRIIKVDNSGNVLWDNIYGGDNDDEAYDIVEASDGGSIIVGSTLSSMSGDVGSNHSSNNYDNWVVKLSASGSLQWQKTFGSSAYEQAFSVVALNGGGGYLVAGATEGNDQDVTGLHGMRDGWIMKIDEMGNLVGQRPVGGTAYDLVYNIIYAGNGYYHIVGASKSTDGDLLESTEGNAWQFLIQPEF